MIFRNALWNLLAGMSAALLSVALPPFLVRRLGPEMFGAWALCLQIASYVNLLNFGMQTVVARQVAIADATSDTDLRNKVTSTAFIILFIAGLVGVVMCFVLSANLGTVAPRASSDLRADMATTILLLGLSFAVSLPVSVFGSVFIGRRQNGPFAITTVVSRIAVFLSVILIVRFRATLVAMGSAWLIATLVGSVSLVWLWWTRVPMPALRLSDFSRKVTAAMAKDAAPLTIWNVAMLMVSGLQLLLVARFDYPAVASFAVSSAIAVFVVGVLQAICSTAVPQAATFFAAHDEAGFSKLLNTMSLLTNLLAAAISITLIVMSSQILTIWAGPTVAQRGAAMLAMLAFGNTLRNVMLTYVMFAIGSGLHRKMLYTPLAEGVVSLTASTLLGLKYGAIGVASGVTIGGSVGVVLLVSQNALGEVMPHFKRSAYVMRSVFLPHIGSVLAVGWFLAKHSTAIGDSVLVTAICLTVSLCVTASPATMWKYIRNFRAQRQINTK